jgi:hypothetical protein
VLKLDTGLVLPQFHIQFDHFFETVRPSTSNKCTFSQWQFISRLVDRQTKDRGQDPQGATKHDKTGPTILPSQSQPDELNAGQQLIPNESNAIEPPTNNTGSSNLPDTTNESPHLHPLSDLPDISHYGL